MLRRKATAATGSKLPMVDPGKNATVRLGFRFVSGISEISLVVSFQRVNLKAGKFAGQLSSRLKKLRPGDINWDVAGHAGKMSQKMAGLGAAATAKLHQPTFTADQTGNFIYVVAKYLVFGSRGIILLQLADFVKQPGALLVVEELAGERFLRPRKSGNRFG